MERFLRIDSHTHSNGISRCSRVSVQELVDGKIELGYDGAILTNHCQEWYYPVEEHSAYVEQVLEEYRKGKAYADEKGFRLYLGLEVSLLDPHYADWLLFGVTEEFLRSAPCLYRLKQKELFELCEKWGLLLVQAHPFRQGPCDPKYMHGVEHNCSPIEVDKFSQVEEYAKTQNLLLTCGTDYHGKEQTYKSGMIVPERCQTAADIAAYLRSAKNVKIFIFDQEKSYKNPISLRK